MSYNPSTHVAIHRGALIITSIVVIVILAVGGWFGYWWLANHTTTNRYNATTHNQQFQAGLISELEDDAQSIAGINVALSTATGRQFTALTAQKEEIVGQFCAIYPSLDPPTPFLSHEAELLHCPV